MDNYIGENIKRARIKAGYSQEKLAEKIDVSLSVISRLETGRTMVSVEKILRIARVLNAPVSCIFEQPGNSSDYAESEEASALCLADPSHSPDLSAVYTDPTDEELYHLIQQLPDKAKCYFKNSLRCYLEIF